LRLSKLSASRVGLTLKVIFAVQDEIDGKVVTTLGMLFKLEEMKALRGSNAAAHNGRSGSLRYT
jgi:hypothetical protein